MFTNHTLLTDDLTYLKKSKMFIVEASCLPEDFSPLNITIEEDLPGKRIRIMNPDTQGSRWFTHNPEADLVKDAEGEIQVWIYREKEGLQLHLIND